MSKRVGAEISRGRLHVIVSTGPVKRALHRLYDITMG